MIIFAIICILAASLIGFLPNEKAITYRIGILICLVGVIALQFA